MSRLFSIQHSSYHSKVHVWFYYLRLILLVLADKDYLWMQDTIRIYKLFVLILSIPAYMTPVSDVMETAIPEERKPLLRLSHI